VFTYVNFYCPITGLPIESEEVTEELTRMFNDERIAFSYKGAAEEWDELSDEEKKAKLEKARYEKVVRRDDDDKAKAEERVFIELVNDRCPINPETKINLDKLNEKLVREFDGQFVAFSNEDAVKAWEELLDADKKAKLDEVRIKVEEDKSTEEKATGK
jgi:hypothetical protein